MKFVIVTQDTSSRTRRSTWGKWNPFDPRVYNLDLAVKIISACSKRNIHCWQIIHLTQKINFLPQEQYIWFQTIFVLRQEDVHKRTFLLPIMDNFSACSKPFFYLKTILSCLFVMVISKIRKCIQKMSI